ncbi:hypothetical protein M5X06_12795 [Paenibacillus alvei]|uniref:Uncharacterized protein n=2 Tax=Paenibacillus alvei TaxID=44250 RepID=A0ABT4GUL9_PAEAL|nr:hypothetical protein [Paenibacillus alvei]MCY9532950.1 hypothetical protein [Paenibacillus alvei]MCY9760398.1 hypothetical protein [Paenibacillus alvei]MCY9767690.1 hypothetical protein [Paenibacillus alvei]
MSQNHEVYVIYRDGEPFKGNRAAYYTKGNANAAIARFSKYSIPCYWRKENAEKIEEERKRYEVVPYVAKEVAE